MLMAEVRRWKQGFAQKHGPENLLVIQGAEQTLRSLSDAIGVLPFIAQKRLVVCEGLPKLAKGQLALALAEMHEATIFAVIDPAPDKRLSVFKEMKELAAEIKEFPALPPARLAAWVQKESLAGGTTMSPAVAASLIDAVGNDQWMLASEIRKLALSGYANITQQMIDDQVLPSGEQVIWKLTDLIGSGRVDEALRFFRHRLDRGEDPYGMWVILLNMVKNLTLLWSARTTSSRDADLPGKTGLHPMAVRGLLPLVKRIDAAGIARIVALSVDCDVALKTGKLKYTAESQDEVIAVTERLMLQCL